MARPNYGLREQCAFEARWRNARVPGEGGPSSGQGLAALTWEHERLELSLGAPDAEALSWHERAGAVLPSTWRALVAVDDPSSVVLEEYLRDGLRIQLPALHAGEVGQLPIAVAWADRERYPDAPWYAVDVPPAHLARIIALAV